MAGQLPATVNADAIREQLEEGAGLWRTCTGCHESEDGHPIGHYPHSDVFGCTLGAGCSECGGIGAVWDTIDYAEMGEEYSRQCAAPGYVPFVGDAGGGP